MLLMEPEERRESGDELREALLRGDMVEVEEGEVLRLRLGEKAVRRRRRGVLLGRAKRLVRVEDIVVGVVGGLLMLLRFEVVVLEEVWSSDCEWAFNRSSCPANECRRCKVFV